MFSFLKLFINASKLSSQFLIVTSTWILLTVLGDFFGYKLMLKANSIISALKSHNFSTIDHLFLEFLILVIYVSFIKGVSKFMDRQAILLFRASLTNNLKLKYLPYLSLYNSHLTGWYFCTHSLYFLVTKELLLKLLKWLICGSFV